MKPEIVAYNIKINDGEIIKILDIEVKIPKNVIAQGKRAVISYLHNATDSYIESFNLKCDKTLTEMYNRITDVKRAEDVVDTFKKLLNLEEERLMLLDYIRLMKDEEVA